MIFLMSKQHIIIGGGVGGLYTAIRLITEGVDPKHILIIEKRHGYTRPGHFNENVFELAEGKAHVTLPHSKAAHIKELERGLYEELRKKNVTFIYETFIGLQPKTDILDAGVITLKDNGTQGIYPADYVFDCTGIKGHVAEAVNTYHRATHDEPFFQSCPLASINPIQDHLFAQVLVETKTSIIDFLLEHPLPSRKTDTTDSQYIAMLAQLKKLGWTYEAFPWFYGFGQEDSNKICLYMETPKDLPKEQQRPWIQLLLEIYSEGAVRDYKELKTSQKYANKPRIVGFKSNPHIMNTMFYKSNNLPTIILVFDALKGFDPRLANGAMSGMICVDKLLDYITFADGRIQKIDFITAESDIFGYLHGEYKNSLVELLTARQKAIYSGKKSFLLKFIRERARLPASESNSRYQYLTNAVNLAYEIAIQNLDPSKRTSNPQKILAHCLNQLTTVYNHIMLKHDDEENCLDFIKNVTIETINCLDWKWRFLEAAVDLSLSHWLQKNIQEHFSCSDEPFISQSIKKAAITLFEQWEQSVGTRNAIWGRQLDWRPSTPISKPSFFARSMAENRKDETSSMPSSTL